MKIRSISLRNFLIIQKADMDLSGGLNVVTGETGSGKSLFVTAIKLLLGDKANKNIVGKWGATGEISAIIEIEAGDKKIKNTLDYLSIDTDEHNCFYVRRTIGEKSFCYINDILVNLNTLEELMVHNVEISSQFENRELFKTEYQTRVLDNFAVPARVSEKYSELYFKLSALKKEIEYLKRMDDPSKRDYVEFQLKEIEKLDVKKGEETELADKMAMMENFQKIQKLSTRIDESLGSASSMLYESDRTAKELSGLMNNIKELSERISSMQIECVDIHRTFNSLMSRIDGNILDDAAKERFDRINTLLMKHSVRTSEELIRKYEDMKSEISDLFSVPDKIRELNKQLFKVRKEAEDCALQMQRHRLKTAIPVELKIKEYLLRFGMNGVQFKVIISKRDDLNEHGLDSVKFMVNTVGGSNLYEIKNLSGGELSRLLLALKLMDNDSGKFILFDEIDSNIGGEIASKAAQELKVNSKLNQMMVVTHFPQTASKGDSHFVVEKTAEESNISSKLYEVKGADRVKELARMMGDSTTQENIKAAEKLLENKGEQDGKKKDRGNNSDL